MAAHSLSLNRGARPLKSRQEIRICHRPQLRPLKAFEDAADSLDGLRNAAGRERPLHGERLAQALKELPQPQVVFTFGLLNLKPEPSMVST